MPDDDRRVVEPVAFPPALDTPLYRSLWADLAGLSDQAVQAHFYRWGEAEGRRGNRIEDRDGFVALIPPTAEALEIGPFCKPLLKGPNARYFDVLDQTGLERRARDIGMVDPRAPPINFVSPTGDLSVIDRHFDYIVSSHCVEHQPDLVHHFQQVGRILRRGGCYLVLVPDKRYCFDSLLAESNTAQVLEAHSERRRIHTLRSVIEHRALITHNDASRHWNGDHGSANDDMVGRVLAAIQEHEASAGSYIDVHAWCFTPDSMGRIMDFLHKTGFTKLRVDRIYPTRKPDNEFWMVLRSD